MSFEDSFQTLLARLGDATNKWKETDLTHAATLKLGEDIAEILEDIRRLLSKRGTFIRWEAAKRELRSAQYADIFATYMEAKTYSYFYKGCWVYRVRDGHVERRDKYGNWIESITECASPGELHPFDKYELYNDNRYSGQMVLGFITLLIAAGEE